MTAIDAVLFDVGNVLIEWDPRHLYRSIFVREDGSADEDRVAWFLTEVCTTEWHVQHDLGRSPDEQIAALVPHHPEHADLIRTFYERFQEMIPGPITPMVDAKRRMKAAGIRNYGLTNFGVETFEETRRRFDFLNAFEDVVVSGAERMKKPDPAIFRICIDRFGITPERTLFIDDSPANIQTASTLGFETHLFKEPGACLEKCRALGLI
ncbi:HAD family phosphatase [uncultured Nisaea sp.]|uniref:HAD family hydrolase n=1 Tax=uncultured Nisaea sp. TaxID=538215 RepID=UPI0030EC0878|tara:strand:+ start:3483 stop:4109 length:627 start_codon:yes stop_codon:yes gene_type:complete